MCPLACVALTGRVVLTGAAGKLGRAVLAELTDHGWDVLAVDRVPVPGWTGHAVRADLTDYGQVLEIVSGGIDEREPRPDAVVHLAAVPAPGLIPNSATFTKNAPATWNVFHACRAAGVRKVVWASSETVLGLPFDRPPPYAPVDEQYRPRPESTYSLVKALEEEMADQWCGQRGRDDGDVGQVGSPTRR